MFWDFTEVSENIAVKLSKKFSFLRRQLLDKSKFMSFYSIYYYYSLFDNSLRKDDYDCLEGLMLFDFICEITFILFKKIVFKI